MVDTFNDLTNGVEIETWEYSCIKIFDGITLLLLWSYSTRMRLISVYTIIMDRRRYSWLIQKKSPNFSNPVVPR